MTAQLSPDDLRELADRVEIRELVARYSAAVDDRDIAAVIDFFTEDGTLSRPPWRATGHAELEAAYRRALGRYEWTVHSVHGHAVDFMGADDAAGFGGLPRRARPRRRGRRGRAALPRRVPQGRRSMAFPQP